MTTRIAPERYIVDAKGRRTGVVLSLERYEQLLEDLHDLAMIVERHKEGVITLEDLKERLRGNDAP